MSKLNKYDQIIDYVKTNWVTALILLCIVVIIALPQIKKGLDLVKSWAKYIFGINIKNNDDDKIVLKADGETVTFTEMLRSLRHDVVKINAYSHKLGIASEYKWIKIRYPKSKIISQSFTTLDLIKGKNKYNNKSVVFDIIKIRLENSKEKEIYFDISTFFGGMVSSELSQGNFIAKKIEDLYK